LTVYTPMYWFHGISRQEFRYTPHIITHLFFSHQKESIFYDPSEAHTLAGNNEQNLKREREPGLRFLFREVTDGFRGKIQLDSGSFRDVGDGSFRDETLFDGMLMFFEVMSEHGESDAIREGEEDAKDGDLL